METHVNNKPVRRVVIAGGGTAGWMVAACLGKSLGKRLDIKLVESDEIGTVGVGEATIPTLQNFHHLLEINEQEFMAATHATFKLGISFENWRDVHQDYIHSFGNTGIDHWTAGFQHFWHKGRERGLAGADDRRGGGEIGFADLQVDHVVAGLLQRIGAGQQGHDMERGDLVAAPAVAGRGGGGGVHRRHHRPPRAGRARGDVHGTLSAIARAATCPSMEPVP